MIGAGVVLIDGFLHEAQAEDARVEIEVALGVGRHRGDVVEAAEGHGRNGGGGIRHGGKYFNVEVICKRAAHFWRGGFGRWAEPRAKLLPPKATEGRAT